MSFHVIVGRDSFKLVWRRTLFKLKWTNNSLYFSNSWFFYLSLNGEKSICNKDLVNDEYIYIYIYINKGTSFKILFHFVYKE